MNTGKISIVSHTKWKFALFVCVPLTGRQKRASEYINGFPSVLLTLFDVIEAQDSGPPKVSRIFIDKIYNLQGMHIFRFPFTIFETHHSVDVYQ